MINPAGDDPDLNAESNVVFAVIIIAAAAVVVALYCCGKAAAELDDLSRKSKR